MARGPGRPAKPTEFDEATLKAARRVLLDVARELRLPRVRYPASTRREPERTVEAPRHLDVAVLALELSQVMERLAGEHVALARELDKVTWEDVGAAFGISMQSAHHRFRELS
jgi:hypothetical protein